MACDHVEGFYICSNENCSFVVPVRSLLLSRQTSDWNYKAKTFVGTNVKPLYLYFYIAIISKYYLQSRSVFDKLHTSPADARIPYIIGDAQFENSFELIPFPVCSQHKVLYEKCNISF